MLEKFSFVRMRIMLMLRNIDFFYIRCKFICFFSNIEKCRIVNDYFRTYALMQYRFFSSKYLIFRPICIKKY